MKHLRKWWQRFRSAVTGRFIGRKAAEANPRETVAERIDR